MVRVGLVSIDLIANVGKLLAPLRRAQKAIGGLTSTAAKITSIAAPITGMVAGFISAGYAISKVTKAFGEIDEIAKQSDRLGITTEKLTELQYAAGLAGVGSEELGRSLEYMMRQGFAPAEIGKVADQLAGMSDPVQRMQFAMKTFGRSGAGMVNVLQGGAAGLEEMASEAQKLGLTFNRIDAAKVEMANDAFSRIGLMIDGVARKIAIELAPFVTWLADAFVKAGTEGEGMGGYVRRGVDMVITAIGWALDAIDLFRDAWAGSKFVVQAAITGMVDLGGLLAEGFEWVVERIVQGFMLGFAEIKTAFINMFAFMMERMSGFLDKIADQLPDSMKGIAKLIDKSSSGWKNLANENWEEMTNRDWTVDLDLGGNAARQFADNMLTELKTSGEAFMDFLGRDRMSTKLRATVDKIRADAEAAAAAAGPELDKVDMMGKQTAGAMERGSQEAFKTIAATTKTMTLEQQQLATQKAMEARLRGIERNTKTKLLPAGLT